MQWTLNFFSFFKNSEWFNTGIHMKWISVFKLIHAKWKIANMHRETIIYTWCEWEQTWLKFIHHSWHNTDIGSVKNDRQQGTCQHAIGPPSGYSNTQSRAGHCCNPGDLPDPTWPRRSPNTPTVLTIQRLKSSVLVSSDTPHWQTKRKRKRLRRLGLSHQENENSFKRVEKVP